jgi:hypothetical protein
MAFASWIRSLGSLLARPRTTRNCRALRRPGAAAKPKVEPLEDRLAPAVLTVNTLADVTATDNFLSLREAIRVVNSGSTSALGHFVSFGGSGGFIGFGGSGGFFGFGGGGFTIGPSDAELAQISGTLGQNDTIQFDPGLAGTITLTGGELLVSQDVIIAGPGANQLAVSGNGASRVFEINTPDLAAAILQSSVPTWGSAPPDSGVAAAISGLAIEHGNSALYGAGIFNNGTLTVSDCTFSDNHALSSVSWPFFYGDGGGIFNTGTLTVRNSTFSQDSANLGGGIMNSFDGAVTVSDSTFTDNSAWAEGEASYGGGIANFGVSLNVSGTTFTHNSADGTFAYDFGEVEVGFGGGIYTLGTATVSTSTFSHNYAGQSGGGISNQGTLAVSASTFSGNAAGNEGGGVFNYYNSLTVSNSTFSGNSAVAGGGIAYDDPDGYGSLTVTNSTLSGNSAGEAGGGIWEDLSEISVGNIPPVTLKNAIIAGNTASWDPDIEAWVQGGGFNLIGDGGDYIAFNGGLAGDQVGTDANPINPLLAPLGNYGGPTQAMPPLPGSPAIAAGSNALAVDAYGDRLLTDQRGPGFPRINPSIGTVDIGAVGYQGLDLAGLIQQALSPSYPVTVQANTSADLTAAVEAVNQLPSHSDAPVTVTIDLAAGASYTDVNASPPAGVPLFLNCHSGGALFVGFSPALTVSSGTVIVTGVTMTTATDAPTVLVTGGSLTLRNDVIQESTGYSDPAIRVTGGTLDLGTAASPGGNTLNINGTGTLVENTTATPIPAAGDLFTVNGQPLAPSSLSGMVWEDFNDDAQVDFGEKGISGVTITLTGTDFLGNAVNLSQQTDSDGAYVFANLLPGTYTLTETQPAGYLQGGDSVGTAGGSLVGTDQFSVSLGLGVDGLNYNFGERPAVGGSVQHGQTAGIGFWNNKNGQALIKALNSGTGHQLGDWLAATLPHMFGAQAGSNNLAGKSNAYIAALFQQDFVLKGVKLDAQVLATGLSVYATNASLDTTGVATQYGFTVSGDGVGTATVNIGTSGDAFGVANNTLLTVMDLLLATDPQTVCGVLYNGNTIQRNEANAVYSAVNQAGNIS